jgi:hypothetical protein
VGFLALQHAAFVSFIVIVDFAACLALLDRVFGSALALGGLRGTGVQGSEQQADGSSEKTGSERCKHCGKLLS